MTPAGAPTVFVMRHDAAVRREGPAAPDASMALNGGGRGIRTPVTLSGKAVFKTACFNRSHIPPREQQCF